MILGPRQYDPTTARFTNPDVFVGAAADVALGADALTGNRYLFAAANPVAYYEDGHCFGGKDRSMRRLVDQRRRSRLVDVAGVQTIVYYTEDIYRNEKVCVRGGVLGEALDYATGNDVSRGVVDSRYSNRFSDGSLVFLGLSVAGASASLFATGPVGLALGGGSAVLGVVSEGLEKARCRAERLTFTTAVGLNTGTAAGLGARIARVGSSAVGKVISRMSAVASIVGASARSIRC